MRYRADRNADQGITGDVLAVVDHTALQDLGMTSVGHRLNVLRGVWELKKEQGIDLGEDDWRPQGESVLQALESVRLVTDCKKMELWKGRLRRSRPVLWISCGISYWSNVSNGDVKVYVQADGKGQRSD